MLFITTSCECGSREVCPTLKLHSNSTTISRVVPFVNGPSASVASHSLRVNEYSLSAELHLLRLRRHWLSVSVSMLLEYGRESW